MFGKDHLDAGRLKLAIGDRGPHEIEPRPAPRLGDTRVIYCIRVDGHRPHTRAV